MGILQYIVTMRNNLAKISLFVITLLIITQNISDVCKGKNKLKIACDCGDTGSDNCGTKELGKWCIEGTCYEEIHLRKLDEDGVKNVERLLTSHDITETTDSSETADTASVPSLSSSRVLASIAGVIVGLF